jgi:cytochrome o ubiquinol oxidase operon protein cyoD
MSDTAARPARGERAPGDERLDGTRAIQAVRGYLVGLCLAAGLTAATFYIADSKLIWGSAIPIALIVLAIAQMGVHLVFFLHITTGPESTNNVLALAFGLLIVFLLLAGSLFIMTHLDHNMVPVSRVMEVQR